MTRWEKLKLAWQMFGNFTAFLVFLRWSILAFQGKPLGYSIFDRTVIAVCLAAVGFLQACDLALTWLEAGAPSTEGE